jgi:hypothetical protein
MPVRYTNLAAQVARGFQCKTLTSRSRVQGRVVGDIYFCGFQTDAEMARVTFKYLWANLSQASDADYDKADPYSRGDRASWATGFMIAAARKIRERLEEQRKDREKKAELPPPPERVMNGAGELVPAPAAPAMTNALVVMHQMKDTAVQKYINDTYFKDCKPRHGRASQASMGTSEAWARGTAYGKSVPLNQNQLPRS